MSKIEERLARLEAQKPSDDRVKHIIVRGMITPGEEEPKSAFAYILAGGGKTQVSMKDGERYSDFEARVRTVAEQVENGEAVE